MADIGDDDEQDSNNENLATRKSNNTIQGKEK